MALTKITPQMFDTSATAHDLNVDNGTFVVDGSASRVGIGTTTPSTLLDVNGTATATVIGAGAGSASAPSLSFSADTNTGLYSLSADNIGFAIAGSARAFLSATQFNMTGNIIASGNLGGTLTTAAQTNITSLGTLSALTISGDLTVDTNTLKVDSSNNRVGVGTASPTAKLQVYDGGIAITTISGSGGEYFSLDNTDTGGRHYALVSTNDSHGSLGGGDFAILDFDVSGNDAARTRLLIDSSGNVGIGTTSPVHDLHIHKTSSSSQSRIQLTTNESGATNADGYAIAMETNGRAYHWLYENAYMAFATNNTERLRIDGSGNVGIGETSFSNYLAPDLVVVASAQNGGITVKSSSTSHAGSLAFADATSGTDTYDGYVQYEHNNRALTLATAATERMRIDSSGNVGIGYSAPSNFNSSANNLVIGSGASGDNTGLTIYSNSNASGSIHFADSTSGTDSYVGDIYYNHVSNFMAFLTSATERMRIDGSGKVGIGTNNPTRSLYVRGTVSTTGGVIATFDGTDSTNTYIQIKNSNSGKSWQIGATSVGVRFYNDETSSHALGISATGAVEAGAGTVSLPGISFLSDLNSGLYQPAADQIGVVAGGSRKLLLTGTDVYFQNLSGNINSASNVVVTKSSAKFEATESGGASVRMIAGGSTGYIGTYSNHELQFLTNSTKRFSVSNAGSVVMDYFLGVRTSTTANGNALAYSLTLSADNSGNAIEVFRTSNSRMVQYMSADGKYYFDMYGSSTPEIRFRNAGTDWMRTQGTRLFVGGSAPQTLGAGGTAAGGAANQTILQVQGAVDMGYQGRYTHGLWGPGNLSSSGRYTHLRTAMWGGGSPHGNSEYIMGGFIITGYRYSTTANHRSIHQFHNWSGSLYNYTVNQLIDGGGWSTASHVYVDSTGYVTIRLDSESSSYRMYYVEYIQYSQYNKIDTAITAVTVSNSTTV